MTVSPEQHKNEHDAALHAAKQVESALQANQWPYALRLARQIEALCKRRIADDYREAFGDGE